MNPTAETDRSHSYVVKVEKRNDSVTMETGGHGNTALTTNRSDLYPCYEPSQARPQCGRQQCPKDDPLGSIVSMTTSRSPVAMTTDADFRPANMPDDAIPVSDDVTMGTKPPTEHSKSFAGTGNTKDVTVEHLEFDGNTVLCRVCGDKASGFHYGVHACEGCKGFFRRSIQQKIQYRPCLKNQMCNIMRVNRNRCQYCRLRKCIAVGMSRDAVRFGRVPKREKAKILEQMQRVNAQMQGTMLNDVLEKPNEVLQHIISAHVQTCEFTRTKFRTLFEKSWERPHFVDCPAHMACPLNPSPDQWENIQKWDEFSSCFTPAIRSVVNFAKSIPGFPVFSQEDQVTLLKAGTFEVLLVHLACLFDSRTNTMMFTNGKLYRRMPQQGTTNAGFLLDSMFDFSDRLNQLRLTDEELALFSAMVIIAHDRPGLRYQDQVQRVHDLISQGLQTMIKSNHPSDPAVFSKLLLKIPDLRTLNTLHSEKLLGLTVPQSGSGSPKHEPAPVATPSVPVSVAPSAHKTCPMSGKSLAGYTSLATASSSASPSVTSASIPSLPFLQAPGPGPYAAVGSAPFPNAPPIIRCPVSVPEVRGQPQPIIPHMVSSDHKEHELILQTPLGSFHRCAPSYTHPPTSLPTVTVKTEDDKKHHPLLMVAKQQHPEAASDLLKSSEYRPNGTSYNLHGGTTKVTNCPEDFIDVDLPAKSTNHRAANTPGDPLRVKGAPNVMSDMRRVMTDPLVPEVFRKRLLESLESDVDPKMSRLWDYDMRSSRSNSLSSSSSHESTDSAYKTISNPATPRSVYELSKSPYTSPAELPPVPRHTPLHQSTPANTLPKVTEENTEVRGHAGSDEADQHSPSSTQSFLPTLRNMLIAGRPTIDRSEDNLPSERATVASPILETPERDCREDHNRQAHASRDSPNFQDHSHDRQGAPSLRENDPTVPDSPSVPGKAGSVQENPATGSTEHWMHKKFKLKQIPSLSERNTPDLAPPVRERAASFSTAVSKLRHKMAPPVLKPISSEAPPRLNSSSTFGSIVYKVMEAALISEQVDEADKKKQVNHVAPEFQPHSAESTSFHTNRGNMGLNKYTRSDTPTSDGCTKITDGRASDSHASRDDSRHSLTNQPSESAPSCNSDVLTQPSAISDPDRLQRRSTPPISTPVETTCPFSNSHSIIRESHMIAHNQISRQSHMDSHNSVTHTVSSRLLSHDTNKQPAATSHNLTGPLSTSHSGPDTSRQRLLPANPSQRHPELLSRLTSAPRVSSLVMPSGGGENRQLKSSTKRVCPCSSPSQSPPPSLFPVAEHSNGRVSGSHSPPPLLPMSHGMTKGSSPPPTLPHMDMPSDSSSSHQSTISSLKDKILKRIDSHDNLLRISPSQSPWSPGTTQEAAPPPAPKRRKYPQDSDSPLPASTAPSGFSLKNPAAPNQMPLPVRAPAPANAFNRNPLPMGMHPALMYNAVQYQALQQLHLQAAHLQRMHQMTTAAGVGMATHPDRPLNNMMAATKSEVSDNPQQHHAAPGYKSNNKHSVITANFGSQEVQPMNLTKPPPALTLLSSVKPEPM